MRRDSGCSHIKLGDDLSPILQGNYGEIDALPFLRINEKTQGKFWRTLFIHSSDIASCTNHELRVRRLDALWRGVIHCGCGALNFNLSFNLP
jgi:hypothetical protein